MVCSVHKAGQYAIESEGRNLSSLHQIVSYSNCSSKSSSCRGRQLHSNQLCHTKGPTPPPPACTLLLQNNLIRYMPLPNKIKLVRHSNQRLLLPCPGREQSITHADLRKVLWKATNAGGFAQYQRGEAVIMATASCPLLVLATTPLQVPLPPPFPPQRMEHLPLHHTVPHQLLSSPACLLLVHDGWWSQHTVQAALPPPPQGKPGGCCPGLCCQGDILEVKMLTAQVPESRVSWKCRKVEPPLLWACLFSAGVWASEVCMAATGCPP